MKRTYILNISLVTVLIAIIAVFSLFAQPSSEFSSKSTGDSLAVTSSITGATVFSTPPPPKAHDLMIKTEGPVEFTLSAENLDLQPNKYRIVVPPRHGKLYGVPPHMVYDPNPDFTGMDIFSFAATDGSRESLGYVSISVN